MSLATLRSSLGRPPRWRWLASVGLLAAVGCADGYSSRAPEASSGLRDTPIARDFTFATQQPVALTFRGAAGAATAVEIVEPGGGVLYRGPLPTSARLELPMATATERLSVHLMTAGARRTLDVKIEDARAAVDL